MATATVPYDQREGFIWFNGSLIPWGDAQLHVLTHGLHYASAVFEGMRAYDGEIFKLIGAQSAPAQIGARSSTSTFPIRSPSSTRRRARWSAPTS